jgi:hypothetical protein
MHLAALPFLSLITMTTMTIDDAGSSSAQPYPLWSSSHAATSHSTADAADDDSMSVASLNEDDFME